MPRMRKGLRTTYTGDHAVLLDTGLGRIFTFNAAGARILQLLQDGATQAEIATTVSRTCSVERAVVERDVAEFLGLLDRHALLESVGLGKEAASC